MKGQKDAATGAACPATSIVSCPTCSLPSLALYSAGLIVLSLSDAPLRYAGLALALLSFFLPWLLRHIKH